MVYLYRGICGSSPLANFKCKLASLLRASHMRHIDSIKLYPFFLNIHSSTACLQLTKCCESHIQNTRKNIAFIAGTFTMPNKVLLFWKGHCSFRWAVREARRAIV